jgi:hypothetical protein
MATATELLEEIVNRLDVLEKRSQNTENLLKILLGKLNKTPSLIKQDNISVAAPILSVQPKQSDFGKLAAQHGIQVEESVTYHENNDLGMTEAAVRAPVRTQRGNKPETGFSKITIGQNLVREDGVALSLANVEIYSENGELISKVRANTRGRWSSVLAPGNYQVQVQRIFPSEQKRNPIEGRYQISVPAADKPIELEQRMLK